MSRFVDLEAPTPVPPAAFLAAHANLPLPQAAPEGTAAAAFAREQAERQARADAAAQKPVTWTWTPGDLTRQEQADLARAIEIQVAIWADLTSVPGSVGVPFARAIERALSTAWGVQISDNRKAA